MHNIWIELRKKQTKHYGTNVLLIFIMDHLASSYIVRCFIRRYALIQVSTCALWRFRISPCIVDFLIYYTFSVQSLLCLARVKRVLFWCLIVNRSNSLYESSDPALENQIQFGFRNTIVLEYKSIMTLVLFGRMSEMPKSAKIDFCFEFFNTSLELQNQSSNRWITDCS